MCVHLLCGFFRKLERLCERETHCIHDVVISNPLWQGHRTSIAYISLGHASTLRIQWVYFPIS